MAEAENTLKAGDVCLDCQQLGIEKYLRYFKINLNGDTLLKCESDMCMYPYEISSSDDEDNDTNNADEVKPISETNSYQLIEDLLQQIKNETAEQNSKTEYLNVKSDDIHAEFEMSFLDGFNDIVNEGLAKTETTEISDNKTNIGLIKHTPPSLPTIDNLVVSPVNNVNVNNNQSLLSLPSLYDTETQKLAKPIINIQSIETLKLSQSVSEDDLPKTLEMFNISTSNVLKTASTTSTNNTSTKKGKVTAKQKDSTHVTFKAAPKTSTQLKNSTLSQPALGIPKANIMKGSDFLKKLALLDEKTPKYNVKRQNARRKSLMKQDDVLDLCTIKEKSSQDNLKHLDNNKVKERNMFSLEAVSQLLNAKKIKNST